AKARNGDWYAWLAAIDACGQKRKMGRCNLGLSRSHPQGVCRVNKLACKLVDPRQPILTRREESDAARPSTCRRRRYVNRYFDSACTEVEASYARKLVTA